jgi:hypothetical protein
MQQAHHSVPEWAALAGLGVKKYGRTADEGTAQSGYEGTKLQLLVGEHGQGSRMRAGSVECISFPTIRQNVASRRHVAAEVARI